MPHDGALMLSDLHGPGSRASCTEGGMKHRTAAIAFTTSLPTSALARNPYYGVPNHQSIYDALDFFDGVLWFLLIVFVVVVLVGVISAIWRWLSGFLTVRIAISAEAFKAIETIRATLPLGFVKYERDSAAGGWFFVWMDRRTRDRLDAARRRSEGHSETIIRLAAGFQ